MKHEITSGLTHRVDYDWFPRKKETLGPRKDRARFVRQESSPHRRSRCLGAGSSSQIPQISFAADHVLPRDIDANDGRSQIESGFVPWCDLR